MYPSMQQPGKVVLVQFLDAVLLFGTKADTLRGDTVCLASDLELSGWVASPKLEVKPTTQIQWMAKRIDGDKHTVHIDAGYLAALVTVWMGLCTNGWSQQGLRRILGRILWASRPRNTTMPFVAGAYAWLQWGPAVVWGLAEAIAVLFCPGSAAPPPRAGPRWFVDTAQHKSL